MIKPGMSCTIRRRVTEEMSARAVGSGLADVLATPALIALMEEAAMNCVLPELAAGQSTVGTRICASHDAATPIGMEVSVTAKVIAVDRRKLTFDITARDDVEQISTATHDRFIIDFDKFQKKADAKLCL